MARKPRDGYSSRPPRGQNASRSRKPNGTRGAVVREKAPAVRRQRTRGEARSTDETTLQHLQDAQFPEQPKRRKKAARKTSRPVVEIAAPSGDPAEAESLSADELLHAVQSTAEALTSQAEETVETGEECADPILTDDPDDTLVEFSMDFDTEDDSEPDASEDPEDPLEAESPAEQEPSEEGVPPIPPDDPSDTLVDFSMDFGTEDDSEPDAAEEFETKGHFLSTEELQTLGEVLGHFSDFSEHHDDDPVGLGVPSTDWNSVHNELRGVRSSIEDLQTASAEIGTLRPLLDEIKSEVDAGNHRRDILTSSLSTLSEDMREMRLQISAASKSAVDSAASVRGMRNQMNQDPGAVAVSTDRSHEWPMLLVGFGLLPLSWAATLYLKTGDLRTALGGLVITNLAACATMLFGRSRNGL